MIEQNSIWMVKLGHNDSIGHEQRGTRPFYVISNTEYNQKSNTPIGFFLSTSKKKKSNIYTLDVDMQGKIENVNVSQIRTISSERFLDKMGTGSNEDLRALVQKFADVILAN